MAGRNAILSALVMFAFTSVVSAQAKPSSAAAAAFPTKAVTAAIQARMALPDGYGLAVAILRHGDLLYARGFGVQRAGGPPVMPDTHFEIGSDTKQFTAAAVPQLKEQGKLSLSDRLAKYVPDFPHAKNITLRQLLDQTSGLPDFVLTNHFVHISQTVQGSLARIEHMAAGPLHFTPGSKWEYSNTNYIALGRVIEIVSGQSYQAYLRKHLFASAGMRDTGFISDEHGFANIATGYWRGIHRKGTLVPAPTLPQPWISAAGSIVSTVSDLARWDTALKAGKIVSPADFALMTAPATLSNGKGDDYGFGWWIDPVHGHTDIYHDGDTLGMSSSNDLFPDKDLEVIVLENRADDAAAHTARAAFVALLPWLDASR